MLKKELATLLGVSESMVSRHAKKGMPTDSLERAQRWRKRHLEPGRIKGSRFDPKKSTGPVGPAAVTASVAVSVPAVDVLEALAVRLNASMAEGPQPSESLVPLRRLLRGMPDHAKPRLPMRVWLALVDYVLSEDATVRNALDMNEALTPCEFGGRAFPTFASTIFCIDCACDWGGHSITGYPAPPDDE